MTENSGDWVLRPKPTSVAAMVDPAEPSAPDRTGAPSSPQPTSPAPGGPGERPTGLGSRLPQPLAQNPTLAVVVVSVGLLALLLRALRKRG
jgi:hypothetical protein